MVTWREATTLPEVREEDETAVLDLMVAEREEALAEAARLRNRVHSLLQQLDPEYGSHLPCLQTEAGLEALENYVYRGTEVLQEERAVAVRRLAQRLRLTHEQVNELADRIRDRARAPLQQ